MPFDVTTPTGERRSLVPSVEPRVVPLDRLLPAEHHPLRRYAAAVVLCGVALWLTVVLHDALQPSLYLLMFAAVTIASWYGGAGPGILASILAAVGIDVLLIPPVGTITMHQPREYVALGIFLAVTLMTSALQDSLRRSRQRARAAALAATSAEQEAVALSRTLEHRVGDLQASEARYRALVEVTATIVWTLPANGLVEDMPMWRALTGQTVDENRGLGWIDALHPEDRARTRETWRRGIAARKACESEYRVRLVDGTYRWYNARAVPVMNEDGSVREWVGICIDIDQRKRAEAEREELLRQAERAREEAEEANRAKTVFLTTMSHELRTPLNAIAGYTELLELGIRGPLTDAQRTDLARIRRNQRHLLALINDVLNFATIEAGRLRFAPAAISVDAALASLGDLIAAQLHTKELEFEHRRCDPALTVYADPERLHQILLNLLSNAVKFTAPGGRITVWGEAHDKVVAICVRDTGRGIPRDRWEAIFEPFVQVERTLTAPTEGTGLGLAISRELARAMGGNLQVQSVEGQGSTFTLVLPHEPSEIAAAL